MTSDGLPGDKRKLQTSRYAEEFVPKNGKILKNSAEQMDCGAESLARKEFTFSVCGDPDNIQYAFTGDPDDALITALSSSCDFEEKVRVDSTILVYGEGGLKGLVNADIPCRYLPQHTHFRLLFLRCPGPGRDEGRGPPATRRDCRHVLFYVEPSGRTVVNTAQRIVLSDRIAQGQTKLCVLGFEGQTVRQALAADGRFDPRVHDDTHKLLEKVEPPRKFQFNHAVDGLNGRSFQVEMSSYRKKLPGGDDGSGSGKNWKQRAGRAAEALPLPLPPPDSGRYPLPRWHVEARKAALLRFKLAVSRNAELGNMSERQYLTRLHQEAQSPIPARAIRRVIDRLASVGCLSWQTPSAQGGGSCFFLRDRYLLTSYHAVEMMAGSSPPDSWPAAVRDAGQVYFGYEEDGQRGRPLKLAAWLEIFDQALDYAMLELQESPPGVQGLAEHCALLPPEAGNLYIAGHPDGQVKKVCPCSVMSCDQQAAGDSANLLENLRAAIAGGDAENYLPDMVMVASHAFNRARYPNTILYKADFHHAASGSPIFNADGRVVGLHCGGEIHKKNKDPERFYVELGRSIKLILHNMACKSDTLATEKSKQIIKDLQSSFK